MTATYANGDPMRVGDVVEVAVEGWRDGKVQQTDRRGVLKCVDKSCVLVSREATNKLLTSWHRPEEVRFVYRKEVSSGSVQPSGGASDADDQDEAGQVREDVPF